MAKHGPNRDYFPKTIVSNMHWDGKRLENWLLRHNVVKTSPDGGTYTVEIEERRKDGHLIVMRTNRRGDRTLIEQPGYSIPDGLAKGINARIRYLKS